MIGGQVMMTIVDPPPATGPLKGRHPARARGHPAQRHPSYPDVPTLIEAGVPDMEVPVWTAFFAPAKTPARDRRAAAEGGGARGADRRSARALRRMGLDPVGGTSEELGRRVARDIEKWTAVAKAANIKND